MVFLEEIRNFHVGPQLLALLTAFLRTEPTPGTPLHQKSKRRI